MVSIFFEVFWFQRKLIDFTHTGTEQPKVCSKNVHGGSFTQLS